MNRGIARYPIVAAGSDRLGGLFARLASWARSVWNFATCVALITLPMPARSQDAPQATTPRPCSLLWRRVNSPAHARADVLVAQARAHLKAFSRARQQHAGWVTRCRIAHAHPPSGDSRPARRGRARALQRWLAREMRDRVHLDNALARLEQARRLAPSDPAIL
ncbi:MAG: hypothetical protein MJD61_02915 [Proteobacteria bacterium]|nr:hypothetical protein [Pseudomonadota bacterium]